MTEPRKIIDQNTTPDEAMELLKVGEVVHAPVLIVGLHRDFRPNTRGVRYWATVRFTTDGEEMRVPLLGLPKAATE